jgi:hypothetical protein
MQIYQKRQFGTPYIHIKFKKTSPIRKSFDLSLSKVLREANISKINGYTVIFEQDIRTIQITEDRKSKEA